MLPALPNTSVPRKVGSGAPATRSATAATANVAASTTTVAATISSSALRSSSSVESVENTRHGAPTVITRSVAKAPSKWRFARAQP